MGTRKHQRSRARTVLRQHRPTQTTRSTATRGESRACMLLTRELFAPFTTHGRRTTRSSAWRRTALNSLLLCASSFVSLQAPSGVRTPGGVTHDCSVMMISFIYCSVLEASRHMTLVQVNLPFRAIWRCTRSQMRLESTDEEGDLWFRGC